MPLSGEALNEMLDCISGFRSSAPGVQAKYVTLATDSTIEPEKTSANAKKVKVKTGTVPATGALVVFTNLNGKTEVGAEEGGLIVGVPYWLFKVNSTEFCVATTKARAEAGEGSCIEFTVEIKVESRVKVIEEHAAKNGRQATGFATSTNLLAEDATAREPEANSTVKVRWLVYYSASTSGTFMGLEAVTEKELASGDIYKVTKSQLFGTGYRI